MLFWQGGEKQGKVSKLSKSEVLMLNIGSMCTGARVLAVHSRTPCIASSAALAMRCCLECACRLPHALSKPNLPLTNPS